ncbi:MAG: AraC family transcriptional regulator [Pseudomonadota bacterium]
MANDPLTDIVRSLHLSGCVFLDAEFHAPWAITAHVTEEDCAPFMPMPEQLLAYHVVTEGRVLVSLDGREGYAGHYVAKRGDVIFLANNELHILASDEGLPLLSGDDLLLPAGEDGLTRIEHGGGGERSRVLCGFIACNGAHCPLLASLPPLLVISLEDVATLQWVEASIAMAARELSAGRVASSAVVSRLSEILLIEALRAYMENTAQPGGWLAGMADPRIARALACIHADLTKTPPVTELAASAGMSRSGFVDWFGKVMGVGPKRYVINQRMLAAQALLKDTKLGLSEVAHRVGYDAPEAFSRAFKRETGQTPADWRLERQA